MRIEEKNSRWLLPIMTILSVLFFGTQSSLTLSANDEIQNVPLLNRNWGSTKSYVLRTLSQDNAIITEISENVIKADCVDQPIKAMYLFNNNGVLIGSSILTGYWINTNPIHKYLKNLTEISSDNISATYKSADEYARFTILKINDNKYKLYSFSHIGTLYEESEDYIDIGLSKMWSKRNLGASTPYEAGDYYAFSEVSTKDYYDIDTYSFGESKKIETFHYYEFSYYNPLKDIGGTKYDAAKYILGDEWQIPNITDFYELKSKCDFTKITLDNNEVIQITGPNRKKIFLPKSGLFDREYLTYEPWREYEFFTGLTCSDSNGINSSTRIILKIRFDDDDTLKTNLNSESKYYGLNIRPIFNK